MLVVNDEEDGGKSDPEPFIEQMDTPVGEMDRFILFDPVSKSKLHLPGLRGDQWIIKKDENKGTWQVCSSSGRHDPVRLEKILKHKNVEHWCLASTHLAVASFLWLGRAVPKIVGKIHHRSNASKCVEFTAMCPYFFGEPFCKNKHRPIARFQIKFIVLYWISKLRLALFIAGVGPF